MATQEALSRESYTKAMSTALSSKCEFDPTAGPYSQFVELCPCSKHTWRPVAPTSFFTNCKANIKDNKVWDIYLSTFHDGLKGHGIVVEGKDKKANIHISQRLMKDREVSTTVMIRDQDNKDSGTLLLSHMYIKHTDITPATFTNTATYLLSKQERESIAETINPESGSDDWNLFWNFNPTRV